MIQTIMKFLYRNKNFKGIGDTNCIRCWDSGIMETTDAEEQFGFCPDCYLGPLVKFTIERTLSWRANK